MSISAKKEMAERRALAGSTTTTTKAAEPAAEPQSYFSRAAAGLDDDSHRPDQIISGSSPTVEYPAGPAWTRTDVGLEPPLGIAVDEMQPCGEAFEVERSLVLAAGTVPGSEEGGLVVSSPAGPSKLAASSDLARAEVLPSPVVETSDGAATLERLAEILPRLARPTIRRRRV
jgi:hypothetical protein